MDALATADGDFLNGIVDQLANASAQGQDNDPHVLNFMLSVIKGIEPRDQLEAMLAAQMAAAPRMVRVIEDLAADWRRLDERIEGVSSEIEVLARQDVGCECLMSVPGIGPIISSAMVAAIGSGDAFAKGRDFAAWLGLVPKKTATGERTVL